MAISFYYLLVEPIFYSSRHRRLQIAVLSAYIRRTVEDLMLEVFCFFPDTFLLMLSVRMATFL